MRGGTFEQDLDDMEAQPTADMARRHPGLIVGVKTAHYSGPEWTPVERAVEAGDAGRHPGDGRFRPGPPQRPLEELLTQKLRPGDIYTHVYSGLRTSWTRRAAPIPGWSRRRTRGVLFDVGHGGGSFPWRIAVPIVKERLSARLDLHRPPHQQHERGHEDMLNVMSKFLALGAAARRRDRAIDLEPGAARSSRSSWDISRWARPADVAVLRVDRGNFGFLDSFGARMAGNQRLSCEMTLRDGKVVYDLNGLAGPEWNRAPSQPPGAR